MAWKNAQNCKSEETYEMPVKKEEKNPDSVGCETNENSSFDVFCQGDSIPDEKPLEFNSCVLSSKRVSNRLKRSKNSEDKRNGETDSRLGKTRRSKIPLKKDAVKSEANPNNNEVDMVNNEIDNYCKSAKFNYSKLKTYPDKSPENNLSFLTRTKSHDEGLESKSQGLESASRTLSLDERVAPPKTKGGGCPVKELMPIHVATALVHGRASFGCVADKEFIKPFVAKLNVDY